MFGQINTRDIDAERFGHVEGRPFFKDIEIEDLKLRGAELLTDFFESGLEEAASPFFIPEGVQVLRAWVGGAFDGRGAIGIVYRAVWMAVDAFIPALPFGKFLTGNECASLRRLLRGSCHGT